MLRISCPWCGVRDEDEFTFGRSFENLRPEDPSTKTDEEWSRHLFTRSNARGKSLERWRHTFGCRQWFVCERDTVTHEISAMYSIADAKSKLIADSANAVSPATEETLSNGNR